MTERIIARKITLYVLRDPVTNAARYVGVTRIGIAERLRRHLRDCIGPNATHPSANWIKDLRAQNTVPVIEALRELDAGEPWGKAETAAISEFRSNGADLLNVKCGGGGTIDRDWCPNAEQRARISAAGIGRIQSEETQLRRSTSLRRFYENPDEMAKRVAIAAIAARSPKARATASARMKAIWSDPIRSEQMRARMREAKARRAGEGS